MASKFSEFDLRYAIHMSELSEDDLKSSYEFYANMFIRNDMIVWTHSDGSSANKLDQFFSVLKLDNSYALGPPKKQAGWPLSKLEDLDAIGVYNRK